MSQSNDGFVVVFFHEIVSHEKKRNLGNSSQPTKKEQKGFLRRSRRNTTV